MRNAMVAGFVFFCAGLGVMVGYKLEPSALAVGAGVVLGVLASVPMMLLALMLVKRSLEAPPPPRVESLPAPQPPVIVVTGGQARELDPRFDFPVHPTGREIRVIGGEGSN